MHSSGERWMICGPWKCLVISRWCCVGSSPLKSADAIGPLSHGWPERNSIETSGEYLHRQPHPSRWKIEGGSHPGSGSRGYPEFCGNSLGQERVTVCYRWKGGNPRTCQHEEGMIVFTGRILVRILPQKGPGSTTNCSINHSTYLANFSGNNQVVSASKG